MPRKGSKQGDEMNQDEQNSQEKPADNEASTSAEIPENLSERLARIESVMEALASRAHSEQPQPPAKKRVITRKGKADQDRDDLIRSAAGDSFESHTVMDSGNHPFQAQSSGNFGQATPGQQTPFMTSSVGGHYADPYVNNNQPMSTTFNSWLLDKTPAMNPMFQGQRMPLASTDMIYNDEIDARVHQILASSASNLSKGTSLQGFFPFKYIKRGRDKICASINSVTALEHLWGIFAMFKDPSVPASIKPALLTHVDEILDDCRSYDWEAAVRPWSEEVFSLIAEGRLPRGWDDVHGIQMLRMTISRASTAKLDQARDNTTRSKPFQQQGFQSQAGFDQNQQKGGPPCQSFNSSQGCSLQSGHMVQGKKMIHVCSYCISELSVAYPHSFVQCRNKKRMDRPHFH